MLAFLCRHAHFLTIGNSDATRKQSHYETSLERSAYRPYPEDRHRADDFSASRDRKPPPAIPKQRINGRSPSGVVSSCGGLDLLGYVLVAVFQHRS
jgi:hypothetical protein